ncbi:MAG TPA: pyridoxamine 5'-phosphate oxidase family protein [Streptosporangiaceae bacterium]|jgi:hypothetical protein|nr:pyridoxamine 5'-phosphate oxidase family protein [Streptosporangiaceae bacterium]
MNWAEMAAAQPRLAEIGQQRLLGKGVVLVATIRADGTPRVSPVEPFVLSGVLWLSMLWGSTKAADLLRDPRILVHSIITNRDGGEGEFKIRGLAQPEEDRDVQRRYAAAVAEALGWNPEPGHFHLFGVDIRHVTFIRYDDSTGDQTVVMWPPGREYIRRGTGATTLGPPEPVTAVLAAS